MVPTEPSQSHCNFGGCLLSCKAALPVFSNTIESRDGKTPPGPNVAALGGSLGKPLAADSPTEPKQPAVGVTDGEREKERSHPSHPFV